MKHTPDSEAYTVALTVYNYAKTSSVSTNGLEPMFDDMRQHFRKLRKATLLKVQDISLGSNSLPSA